MTPIEGKSGSTGTHGEQVKKGRQSTFLNERNFLNVVNVVKLFLPQQNTAERKVKMPIELVERRLLGKLNHELEGLENNLEERAEGSCVENLTRNIEYIYSLGENIPELEEYLRRTERRIQIKGDNLPIIGKKMYIFSYPYDRKRIKKEDRIDFFSHWITGSFLINLAHRLDTQAISEKVASEWDSGDKRERKYMEGFSKLTKRGMVKEIMKLNTRTYWTTIPKA